MIVEIHNANQKACDVCERTNIGVTYVYIDTGSDEVRVCVDCLRILTAMAEGGLQACDIDVADYRQGGIESGMQDPTRKETPDG